MGKQAIVTNVPCTYPPSMVNGVMISDFLTPRGRRDFTYPESLIEEVESRFGPYQLYITEVYTPGNVDKILDQLFTELDYKTKVNRYLMEQYGWDVFATHYWGTDRFQHELWHLLDETHPFFDRKEHDAHIGRIHEYWHAVDSTLGELFDDVGDDSTVYLGSDHGFGPIKRFLCFNVWLIDQGLAGVEARRDDAIQAGDLQARSDARSCLPLGDEDGFRRTSIVGWRDKSLKADEARESADALAGRRRLVSHGRFFKRQLRTDIHKPSRARRTRNRGTGS